MRAGTIPGNNAYLTADTTLHLHTASYSPGAAGGAHKFVLLSISASEILSMNLDLTGMQYSQYGFSNITVMGAQPDANSRIFTQLFRGNAYDVTPTVSGGSNYAFGVEIVNHKTIPLTWSYHPMFHIPTNLVPSRSTWQYKFDEGSKLLAADDDGKIPDDSPAVETNDAAGSLYRSDDVPVYVEFQLQNGPTNLCYYTKTLLPIFPLSLSQTKYFIVRNILDWGDLVENNNVSVKIVKKIQFGSGPLNGATDGSQPGFRTVLAEYALNSTTVHEWGHACGLEHRGDLSTNGIPLNPGPTNNAVMQAEAWTTPLKVNRFERDQMNSF